MRHAKLAESIGVFSSLVGRRIQSTFQNLKTCDTLPPLRLKIPVPVLGSVQLLCSGGVTQPRARGRAWGGGHGRLS